MSPLPLFSTASWATLSSPDARATLDMLQSDAPWRGIEDVPRFLARTVMNTLQKDLDERPSGDHDYRRKCIKCMQKLSQAHDVLPRGFYLPRSELKLMGSRSYGGGAFSDIFRGIYHQRSVCLKVLRTHCFGRLRSDIVEKAFCAEAMVWRQLDHPNILPFLGVSTDLFPSRLCLISPWMENGNIMSYLEENPLHYRFGSIYDVASGMSYLHSLDPPVIHADIRGANVLVKSDGSCCLTDFGISVVPGTQGPGTSTLARGNIRWHGPELINTAHFDSQYFPGIDIYSFGCTVIEIYTGLPPYADLRNDAAVITEMFLLKRLPTQPANSILPRHIWEHVVRPCLASSPRDRPSATQLLEILLSIELDDVDDQSPPMDLTAEEDVDMTLSSTFVDYGATLANYMNMLQSSPDATPVRGESSPAFNPSTALHPTTRTWDRRGDTHALSSPYADTPLLDFDTSPEETPIMDFLPTPDLRDVDHWFGERQRASGFNLKRNV